MNEPEPVYIPTEMEPWKATIAPANSWVYFITFSSGWIEELGSFFRPTRRGAERFARRGIARRNRRNEGRSYEVHE